MPEWQDMLKWPHRVLTNKVKVFHLSSSAQEVFQEACSESHNAVHKIDPRLPTFAS